MIVKCLNRITTHTEISAAHIAHFLLGHSDSKTSHQFTKLNLYTGLSWLTRESKKEEAALNDVPLSDLCEKDKDNHGDSNSDSDDDNEVITSCTNDDDIVDNDDEDNDDITYSVSTGNTGLVFVNNLIDYINRPDQFKEMCWYEFNEKVYKQKFNDEDKKRNDKILIQSL